MIKRKKYKKKISLKKVFIMSSIFIITLFMASGFALLRQNLKITSIANLYASDTFLWKQIIENRLVTSGNGFYKIDNQNKYVYIGNDEKNYIKIDNELWRILSIENDHTIKIIKWDNNINKSFDEASDQLEENTYCTSPSLGCNSWSQQSIFANGDLTGKVNNNSTLLTYLNNDFYNSISTESKKYFAKHLFNIGPVEINENTTFSNILSQEQDFSWEGYIAIPSISDYLYASNPSSDSIILNQNLNENYLVNYNYSNKIKWTINPLINDASKLWVINYDKTLKTKDAKTEEEEIETVTYEYLVLPVGYLKDSVKLQNINDATAGTSSNPFIIE